MMAARIPVDRIDATKQVEPNLNNEGTTSKCPPKRNDRQRLGATRPCRLLIARLLLVTTLIALAVLSWRAIEMAWKTTTNKTPREEEAILLSMFRDDYVTKSTQIYPKKIADKTLALLYPPGLLGGYRNQVLRFIAFCVYAKQNNISRILLPSLLWSTQLDGIGTHVEWFPIPFEWIFDIDHWNKFAPKHVPLLVDSISTDGTKRDCWMRALERDDLERLRSTARSIVSVEHATATSNAHFYTFQQIVSPSNDMGADRSTDTAIIVNHLQRAALLQGAIRPLINITVPFVTKQSNINLRKVDFSDLTQDCRNPYVYGGGTRAGKLWNDYISYQKAGIIPGERIQGNASSVVPFEIDLWVYRALRPNASWREVAAACVNQHATTGKYIALHARIELEIMGHNCGLKMEKNLTRILQHVYRLHDELTAHPTNETTEAPSELSGLFIAVSRAGMTDSRSSSYNRFQKYADENLRLLDKLTNHSKQKEAQNQERLPVFECGERVLQEYYDSHRDVPDHGSLLQSVVNFHIAVAADVFVGVEGSSYSTDVLTTRYWLGKGMGNYRYTKAGIDRVENWGLPRPHSNCKRKK